MTRFYLAHDGDDRVMECVPGVGMNLHKICGSPDAARREAWRLNMDHAEIPPGRSQRLAAMLRRL